MESAKTTDCTTIPEPPKEDCKACGAPVEYKLRDGWDSELGLAKRFSASKNLSWFFFYSRDGHEECQDRLRALADKEARKERIELARKARLDEVDKWYAQATLPKDLRLKTFGNFECDADNQKAVLRLKAWRPGDDFGFIISGPAGTGKSHLGFALLNRINDEYAASDSDEMPYLTERHSLPSYFSVAELLAGMRTNQGSSEIPWRALKEAPVLFDDLGTENITDWSRDILFRIFDHRLNQRYPTFITTNLTLSELKDRLHERVTSRILGLCIPVMLKGKDRRMDVLADKVKLLNARIGA